MNGHDRKRGRNVVEESYGGPSEVVVTPRWSPTSEQKNMLVSFYRQGINKPSLDQIHQIKARLRAFGRVEDKNVFYWFHNYKAKERAQKLKLKQNSEESVTSPPPPRPNVPQQQTDKNHDIGNSNKRLSTTACRARSSLGFETLENDMLTLSSAAMSGYDPVPHRTGEATHVINDNKNGTTINISDNVRETLELFPLNPTGNFH